MKRRSVFALILITLIVFSGCANKGEPSDNNWHDIEGIKYKGGYVASNKELKVFDFVYMYFLNNNKDKDESLTNAHLFTLTYYNAKKYNSLTDTEIEDILRLCDNLATDNAELYLNMGLSSIEQYKLFSLMENTINKYKKTMFETYEINENDLKEYYKKNEIKYKEVLLQVVFYSVKDESGNRYPDSVIEEKINKASSHIGKIKTNGEMDDLIKQESEDPAVSETGGKMNFVLGEYIKNDDIYAFSSDPKTKTGDMVIIDDEYGIYLIRCESFEDYDNSVIVKDKVKNDFLNIKFNESIKSLYEEDESKLEYTNNDLIKKITEMESNG